MYDKDLSNFEDPNSEGLTIISTTYVGDNMCIKAQAMGTAAGSLAEAPDRPADESQVHS